MDRVIETLLSAAIRAPSGDNTQPWRFVVDSEAHRIGLYLDETRDPSPMNSGQRMARIAIGAALENLLRASENLGLTARLLPPQDAALAVVEIDDLACAKGEMDPAIRARVTNRRLYDGRPIDREVLAELERQCPARDGVRTLWIHQRDRIDALASLIGRADALMLSEPSMRRAFLDNIRFDAPWDAAVEEGLPLASLELSAPDRTALRLMRWVPNWLLKLGGAARKFAAQGENLAKSASGLCIVLEKEATAESEVSAGRAVERAWLALISQGLCAQPMMSLAILESILSRGSTDLLASLGKQQALSAVEHFHKLGPQESDGNIAFIMRFGCATPPTSTAGRLPLSVSVSERCEGAPD